MTNKYNLNNKKIIEYIFFRGSILNQNGIGISIDELNQLAQENMDIDLPLEELKKRVDKKFEKYSINQTTRLFNNINNINKFRNYKDDFARIMVKYGVQNSGILINPPLSYYDFESDNKNQAYEINHYIAMIKDLNKNNQNNNFYCGMIIPYEEDKEQYYAEIRKKIDYAVYQIDLKNNTYDEAITTACHALSTGIYDFIDIPQRFFEIDFKNSQYSYSDNLEKYKISCFQICKESAELNVPIHVDLNIDNDLTKVFLEVAKNTKVKLIISNELLNKNLLELKAYNILENNYNPVLARKNNPRLDELLKHILENNDTYDTIYALKIFDDVIISLDNLKKPLKEVKEEINSLIKTILNKKTVLIHEKISNIENQMQNLKDKKETKVEYEQLKFQIEYYASAYKKLEDLIFIMTDAVNSSIDELRCNSFVDLRECVYNLLENKLTYYTPKRNETAMKVLKIADKNKVNTVNKKLKKNSSGFASLIIIIVILFSVLALGFTLGHFIKTIR